MFLPAGTGLAHLSGLSPLARHHSPTQSPSGLLATALSHGSRWRMLRPGAGHFSASVSPALREQLLPPVLQLGPLQACHQLLLRGTTASDLGAPGSSVQEPGWTSLHAHPRLSEPRRHTRHVSTRSRLSQATAWDPPSALLPRPAGSNLPERAGGPPSRLP